MLCHIIVSVVHEPSHKWKESLFCGGFWPVLAGVPFVETEAETETETRKRQLFTLNRKVNTLPGRQKNGQEKTMFLP